VSTTVTTRGASGVVSSFTRSVSHDSALRLFNRPDLGELLYNTDWE
jgi:hypothetical protein